MPASLLPLIAPCQGLGICFALCSSSVSQYPLESARKKSSILGLLFLGFTVLMEDPREFSTSSSKRRLKGEDVPIRTDTKRTSDNGRIINLPKA